MGIASPPSVLRTSGVLTGPGAVRVHPEGNMDRLKLTTTSNLPHLHIIPGIYLGIYIIKKDIIKVFLAILGFGSSFGHLVLIYMISEVKDF